MEIIWVVRRTARVKPRESGVWEERAKETTHVSKDGAIQCASNFLAEIPNRGVINNFDRMVEEEVLSIEVIERTIEEKTISLVYEAKE